MKTHAHSHDHTPAPAEHDHSQCEAAEAAAEHEHHAGHADHSGHGGHGHAGHDMGDHAEMFRRKFWVSLAMTLPAVVYSHMLQELLGYSAPMFPGHQWVAPIFGTAVFLYGGPVFLNGGWQELKDRK